MNTSPIYKFIDTNRYYTVALFYGTGLIGESATMPKVTNNNFEFTRKALLSCLPMVTMLKNNEDFGFYFDCKSPHFSFKLEVKSTGQARFYIPDINLNESNKYSGILRLIKNQPFQVNPYISNIEIDFMTMGQIINHCLKQSFQFDTAIKLTSHADVSLLVNRLPVTATEESSENSFSAAEWFNKNPWVESIDNECMKNRPALIELFKAKGYELWQERSLTLQCTCSKERFIEVINMIDAAGKPDGLVQDSIEVTCQYCQKKYTISDSELKLNIN